MNINIIPFNEYIKRRRNVFIIIQIGNVSKGEKQTEPSFPCFDNLFSHAMAMTRKGTQEENGREEKVTHPAYTARGRRTKRKRGKNRCME
jgi:hypothetical protein